MMGGFPCGHQARKNFSREKNFFLNKRNRYSFRGCKIVTPVKNENEPVISEDIRLEDIIFAPLSLPAYQRPFCWKDKEILQFWESICDSEANPTHIGSIIVYHESEEKQLLVDGQQRLTTFSLVLLSIAGTLKLEEKKLELLEREVVEGEEEADYLSNAKAIIDELLINIPDKGKFRENLLHNIHFTKITVNAKYPDLAFLFFYNHNAGGKPLNDFDLLKAHHLRFLDNKNENLSRRTAKNWNRINIPHSTQQDAGIYLHEALKLLYRMRKLFRKQEIEEERVHHIRDEYGSSPGIQGLAVWPPQRIYFDMLFSGGEDFFHYSYIFYRKYREFCKKNSVLHYLDAWQHRHFHEMLECMTFGYYLKFGTLYLSEAILCIGLLFGQFRYADNRATRQYVHTKAQQSELIHLLNSGTSIPLFFGSLLQMIRRANPGKKINELTGVRRDYQVKLSNIYNELKGKIKSQVLNEFVQSYLF